MATVRKMVTVATRPRPRSRNEGGNLYSIRGTDMTERFQSGDPIREKAYSIQMGDVESTVTIRQKRKIGLGGFPAYKRYFSYKTKCIEPLG